MLKITLNIIILIIYRWIKIPKIKRSKYYLIDCFSICFDNFIKEKLLCNYIIIIYQLKNPIIIYQISYQKVDSYIRNLLTH
jgi:hypothetical protein